MRGYTRLCEGGMRTPAMIRWPGKIASGGVSDEIVADLDIYPIVANFVGGKGYADKPEVVHGEMSPSDRVLNRDARRHIAGGGSHVPSDDRLIGP